MSTLRREGQCETCGRPHLREGDRLIRGCLCHWRAPRYRHGASYGVMEPVAPAPAPAPAPEPERAPWPWSGWLG